MQRRACGRASVRQGDRSISPQPATREERREGAAYETRVSHQSCARARPQDKERRTTRREKEKDRGSKGEEEEEEGGGGERERGRLRGRGSFKRAEHARAGGVRLRRRCG